MIDNLSFITIPICIAFGKLSYNYFGTFGAVSVLLIMIIIGFAFHLAALRPQQKEAKQNQR
jgi:hypothetical protein